MAEAWRNRIVGYGEEAPEQLLANPKNWRIHPKAQQAAMVGVFKEIGIVQNVLVNQRTGFVVDGHLRVSVAISHGQPTIPVTYVDLTEAEEAEVLATMDPLSAMAGADKEQLDALLKDVNSGEAAVQQMLAELVASQGMYGDKPEAEEGELTIGPELLERHDYLVFYFDNQFDWQVACEKYGVTQTLTAAVGKSTLRGHGIGRVLPGKRLL